MEKLRKLFEISLFYSIETKRLLPAAAIRKGILSNRYLEHIAENRRLLELSTGDFKQTVLNLGPKSVQGFS